ncbi:conserved hypothetical protein [Leishmania mexicana MHOM/GT/2001/U1103]|uniref:Uncharacterized protein n=1 Tax=Leishmania mexicana (strain MHOM/GT/2001/U1103) TaxID=929439 RepID=E9B547_LEIMU|nr:conserved hypothetical protein [Leishmania mexicana MHOM/GT/2001/U1103]CBZ30366.1 conserved hypothetical protein [Leishmania mexicana MHOM/GT/2001/U1103]
MASISPARPSIEPSLRVREPSAANTRHQKTSMPSGYCRPGRAVEETATLEPAGCIFTTTVAEEFVRADAMTVSMVTTPLASVQCTPRLQRGRENAVRSPESILGHCKPARSPRPSQVAELRLTANEVGVLSTPHVGHGLRTRAASAAGGTRRSVTDKADGSLTTMALSAVLRPRRNSLCELDRLDLLSAVAESDVGTDDLAPTAASFQLTCEGTEWCAVVAAHTEAVHRLATIDITLGCGVTTCELSKLTMIATEAAGLQVRFQLVTWGDAQREATFRRRLEMFEFQRLTRLYQTTVTTTTSRPPADGEIIQWSPRSVEDNSHLPEGVVAFTPNNHRWVSEDRRQLVSEFETTLEDMQSMLFQKEQELQHLTSQLEEERRCSGQNVADLQNQLITMRLDHACMDKELESISAALLDTQQSCNVLRQLVTESEVRHRFEMEHAEEEYAVLEKERAQLINQYKTQITSLNEQLHVANKQLEDATHTKDLTDTTYTSVKADLESFRTHLTTSGEQNDKHDPLASYRRGIVDAVRSEYEAQAAELVDSAELVEARDALAAAEQRCDALAAAHAEAVAALEARSAASEGELAAARDAIRAAEERLAEADSEHARVVAALEAKACAAEREAAAARAKQEAVVSCTRGIVDAVRSEYEAQAAELVDSAELVEARDALAAAEQRCDALAAAHAEAVAALEARSAASEGELAAARDAIRAAEERLAEADSEHARVVAALEAKACAAEREAAAARANQEAVVSCTRGIVDAVRSEYEAQAAELVDSAELVEARDALAAAEQRCDALAAAHAEAVAALEARSAASEGELAAARDAIRAAEERLAEADSEHARVVAALEAKACAAEREAAAARAKQEAVVSCTRGIVDAVRSEYEAQAAELVDSAELVEARDALAAAHAEAVAALEARSAASEGELAAARDAIRAAEERLVEADSEHARVVAALEAKACAAEREAAAARAKQEAVVSCTRGIVDAVRSEYEAQAAELVDSAELVEARDALAAAHAEAVAALEARSAASEGELAAARDAIRAAEERLAEADSEHARVVAALEAKACAAEREAAAARANQEAVVSCTRGIVDAVRSEYEAQAAELVDSAELVEARDALAAAEQRCDALAAAHAEAVAALEARSAASEGELAAARDAIRAAEERLAEADSEHARVVAALEAKACAAEREAAAARANQEAVVSCTRGIVDAVRSEYEAQAAELVDSAELVEARDALAAAEQRCDALAAAHAEAVAALEARSAASEGELAAARDAIRAAEERLAEADSEHARVVAALEAKACAAEREAAAARANQEAVVSCTRGIVDAVRSEYEAQAAELVDSAELVEARDALAAAEQRCDALAAAHAEAVAALEARSAASEGELAVREMGSCYDDVSPENFRGLFDASDSREFFVAGMQYGVEVLREEFESRASKLVSCARRMVGAKAAVEGARRRCAEVSAKWARADVCVGDEKEFLKGEVVAAHSEFKAMMDRYLEAEAAADAEEDADEDHRCEAIFCALTRELKGAREKLKTMQQINRMLREKFRSELQSSERSIPYSC